MFVGGVVGRALPWPSPTSTHPCLKGRSVSSLCSSAAVHFPLGPRSKIFTLRSRAFHSKPCSPGIRGASTRLVFPNRSKENVAGNWHQRAGLTCFSSSTASLHDSSTSSSSSMQNDERAPQLQALHNCPPHGLNAQQLAELKERLDLAKARRTASKLPLSVREGAVVVQDSSNAAEGTPVLSDLPSSVYLNQQASKHGSLVLGLSTPGGQAMSLLDAVVGKLAPGRMLMSARCKLWWMTPEWRTSTLQIPPETQFLLVELGPPGAGPYALVLPLIDGDFRGTLRSPVRPHNCPEGSLTLRVESGDHRVVAEKWDAVLHVSAGWDPYTLVEQGVQAAARLSGGAEPRATKLLPPSIDVFGWCTWDAFYSTVSAKGIQVR
ncbi:raffinose synthase or seed imbibition protein Sip1-domain-containing protein [Dunaliella salina]|uniref:Raffinose synthase or seed imbibition protein Sip1-domain-containing protein n=1 Tax=Dunaliella salina TaxID=3046 RepID=A0ABQ7H8G0_DUNSA|nr:raffinose synthase or seed imbibition protein Sip1-domain-containing protein [Dunaliella salina]|eukprot:KAF5843132.1 raffinose synthase or seed imbibition protein Sip1-domain-containing protein [Dunaliella salina]